MYRCIRTGVCVWSGQNMCEYSLNVYIMLRMIRVHDNRCVFLIRGINVSKAHFMRSSVQLDSGLLFINSG